MHRAEPERSGGVSPPNSTSTACLRVCCGWLSVYRFMPLWTRLSKCKKPRGKRETKQQSMANPRIHIINALILLMNYFLVAGTGFEPVTFRL